MLRVLELKETYISYLKLVSQITKNDFRTAIRSERFENERLRPTQRHLSSKPSGDLLRILLSFGQLWTDSIIEVGRENSHNLSRNHIKVSAFSSCGTFFDF